MNNIVHYIYPTINYIYYLRFIRIIR